MVLKEWLFFWAFNLFSNNKMKQNCLKCIILTAAENTKNAKIFDKFPTSRSNIPCNLIRRLTSGNVEKKVCIVGAGPAGFYAAQQILKVRIQFFFANY